MKRFLTSLGASVALALALIAPAVNADSARFWEINMYKPTSSTAHTVNVEYQAFSTVASDQMTVTLLGTPTSVPSQTTTKSYGDSGIFQVGLADGTYTLHVEATNSGDSGVIKSTAPETFTVSTAPSGGTTVVFVNNGSTTSGRGGNGATASSGTGSQVLGTQTTGNSTSGSTTGANGQVNAPGSSKTGTNSNNGKVLGVATTNNHTTRNVWIASVAAGLALLLALYYWLVRRTGTNR